MGYKDRAEIAAELGITPQAVGKRLRTSGLISQCQKSGRRLLIPDDVAEKLRDYKGNQSETNETKSETYETGNETNETEFDENETGNETNETKSETYETGNETSRQPIPWEVYEDLRKQLAIKDEQIKSLSEALINAQEQGKAAQLLQAADKREALLEAGNAERETDIEDKPKSWWNKLKESLRG